jgi:hypothetical protein
VEENREKRKNQTHPQNFIRVFYFFSDSVIIPTRKNRPKKSGEKTT